MSVTYKLQIGTNSDGSVFIDSPVTGRIRSVKWAGVFTAGAGGIGQLYIELSRAATNQVSTNNPRGVISQASMATPAASQGAMIATEHTMDEPIRFGERLYLNGAGGTANLGVMSVACFVTIA